jgi:hypothetical protein
MAKTKSIRTKWYGKALIGVCSLVLILVIIDVALNILVKIQVNKIINRKSDSTYYVKLQNPSASILRSTISVDKVIFVPRASLGDSLHKDGIYGTAKSVEIKGFRILNLLFNDKLRAKSVTIENPIAVLYQKGDTDNIRNAVAAPLKKTITVDDVFIIHGGLTIIDAKTDRIMLSAHHIDFNLCGIVITDATLDEKIPFKFTDYKLDCDSLSYHPNEFYDIKTKKIKTTKTNLRIDKFEMLPTYSRREFVAKIPKEKDLYTVLCDSITLSKIDWGFKQDDLFVHCNTIALQQASTNIYRPKQPPNDLTKKYLYNKLLRDLTFDLQVDTLKVRNSILEYEEEKSAELGPGKLRFTKFNLTATSICSGFKKSILPDLKIKINCSLMNASPLSINWKLNVMDKSDGFHISGRLTNFEAEKIIPFSKPYINVTTKGIIDEVRFYFTGNDKHSSGEFKVEYDDLKFTIYKKDNPKKKNKLATFIAKIFVKKDTKDKLKEVHIDVARIPEKSFYNLLWRSIQEGLKKILV